MNDEVVGIFKGLDLIMMGNLLRDIRCKECEGYEERMKPCEI